MSLALELLAVFEMYYAKIVCIEALMVLLSIILCVSGQHASLKDHHFGELNFRVNLNVNFGLNEWRKEQFENAVGEHLKHSLLKILYSSYSYALEQSVAQLSLPVPE